MKSKDNSINDIFNKLESKNPIKGSFPNNNCKIDIETFSNKLNQSIHITNSVLYSSLENKNDAKPNETGSHFIRKILNDNNLFNEKLESGNFLIEKYQKKLRLKSNKREISDKAFGKKLEKQLRYFKIPENHAKYSMYAPMNKIWRQYISSLLENEKNDDNFFLKFLKADLHGSILKILCSKCKNYEGESGIVIQETMRTFKIVTISNKIITILKQNSIFLIEVFGKHLKIYGQHLCYRPSDRLKIKFKMKDSTQFILDNIEEDKI